MDYTTKLASFRTDILFFPYDFLLRLLDETPCARRFSKIRECTRRLPLTRVVARLLEIQAETTMNHILIDSTGAPRPLLLPPLPRACGNRARVE